MNTYTIYLIPRTLQVCTVKAEQLTIVLSEGVRGEDIGALLDRAYRKNLTAAAVCDQTKRIVRRSIRQKRRKGRVPEGSMPLTPNAVTALLIWQREGAVAA